MKITVLASHILAAAVLSVCLAYSAAAESTGPAGSPGSQQIRMEELGISLCVPVGWRIQMLDGQAACLVPGTEARRELALWSGVSGREIGLWPIEMVAWTSPAPSHSPQQAVAGHEQLLADTYSYQRETIEPFTTTFDVSGVAVSGKIRIEEDDLVVLFAGYALSNRSIVVGTFCHPADREVIARLFQPLIRSVGPVRAPSMGTPPQLPASAASPRIDRPETSVCIEHPPSVTQPISVVSAESSIEPHRMSDPQRLASLPQTDREPSIPTSLRLPNAGAAAEQPVVEAPSEASTLHAHPETEPVSVPSPPPEAEQAPATAPADEVLSGQWVEHTLPTGVTLPAPPGWSVAVENGVLHAYNSDLACGIVACPLFDIPSLAGLTPGPGIDADTICQYWQQLMGYSFTATSHLCIQRFGQTFDVFSGTLAQGDDTARAIVTIAADEPIILLTAAYAPAEQFEQRLPGLQRILAGISLPRLAATIPGQLSNQTLNWASPDGHLTGQAPEGWQILADISHYNGHTVITVDGHCEEQPRLRFAWRQPYTPFFRELTPLLRGLGRLPGEQYRDHQYETPFSNRVCYAQVAG